MNATTMARQGVTLWISYVGFSAPSNAAGSRFGVGRTRDEASRNAAHWHNQAPWEKRRRVTVFDQNSLATVSERDELICGRVLPLEETLEFHPAALQAAGRRAWDLARQGLTASAILAWYEACAAAQVQP